MNNFWEGVTGDEKKAFAGGFELIPDGTVAVAEIQAFSFLSDPEKGSMYEVKWKIIGNDYNGRILFQKIRAFDANEDKAKRARNMLMLMFNMFDIGLSHSEAPKSDDLIAFQGKVASILIKTWDQGGKSGNWVSEVHPSDYVAPVVSGTIESAFSRNPRPVGNEDLPF